MVRPGGTVIEAGAFVDMGPVPINPNSQVCIKGVTHPRRRRRDARPVPAGPGHADAAPRPAPLRPRDHPPGQPGRGRLGARARPDGRGDEGARRPQRRLSLQRGSDDSVPAARTVPGTETPASRRLSPFRHTPNGCSSHSGPDRCNAAVTAVSRPQRRCLAPVSSGTTWAAGAAAGRPARATARPGSRRCPTSRSSSGRERSSSAAPRLLRVGHEGGVEERPPDDEAARAGPAGILDLAADHVLARAAAEQHPGDQRPTAASSASQPAAVPGYCSLSTSGSSAASRRAPSTTSSA